MRFGDALIVSVVGALAIYTYIKVKYVWRQPRPETKVRYQTIAAYKRRARTA